MPGKLSHAASILDACARGILDVSPGDPLANAVLGLCDPGGPEPLDMVLHCPACCYQHIDEAKVDFDSQPEWLNNLWGGKDHPDYQEAAAEHDAWQAKQWFNPPHRSHLCKACGCVWRPADVPTNGVRAITTRGKADTWPRVGV